MPGLKLRDLHFPELRLPEMTRDDIAKALGEARTELGEVRKDLNDFRREFEMPRIDLTSVELPRSEDVAKEARAAAKDARDVATTVSKNVGKSVGKNAKSAAQAAGLVKRPSRLPFVLAGLVTLGVVGWAMINSPGIKTRIRQASQQAREMIAERRATWDDDDPRAFDAAVAVPVEPSAYADSLTTADSPFAEPPSGLPTGFGKGNGTHTIESDETARA